MKPKNGFIKENICGIPYEPDAAFTMKNIIDKLLN